MSNIKATMKQCREKFVENFGFCVKHYKCDVFSIDFSDGERVEVEFIGVLIENTPPMCIVRLIGTFVYDASIFEKGQIYEQQHTCTRTNGLQQFALTNFSDLKKIFKKFNVDKRIINKQY